MVFRTRKRRREENLPHLTSQGEESDHTDQKFVFSKKSQVGRTSDYDDLSREPSPGFSDRFENFSLVFNSLRFYLG